MSNMSNSQEVFSCFAPFIQDYIYRSGWQTIRPVQVDAARVLFYTDHNLLLTSSTASGKTEAAFFPVLSMLSEDDAESFGALYIAPLKSLINDQFSRMEELLDLSHIPVFHWHGDVAMSHKNKALKNPRGILQITPESLESMLVNRSCDLVRLFGNLRFVILDEVHTLTGTDRGNQIICQLCRLSRLIGKDPVRIGLSATIGDEQVAARWLGGGSRRKTDVVGMKEGNTTWRLGLEHFFIQNESANQTGNGAVKEDGAGVSADPSGKTEDKDQKPGHYRPLDPGFEYIYDCTKGKKCLVFSNSREETEYLTATLRQIADKRQEPDIFQIHHGNLSAAIREEAEAKLKDDDAQTVTCATVTLELGIDIGRLERVVQLDAPTSVASMLQRIGRSGRRGAAPEMMMVFREEDPLPNTPLPQLMPWGLLRAIAIIQLYLEERFIEPPRIKKMPFSLLFQQTLSILASSGELTAKTLAERVLTLPPFTEISTDDYRLLLVSMLNQDYIEMTEEKGLIVGLKGERLVNSFKFYAVFKDSEDYTVRAGSDEIGTITTPPPVGDRFALAGRVWEVEELDIPRKLIYAKAVNGKMEISWPGDYGEIHTRILERMKQVLEEDIEYPYLKPNAKKRLDSARRAARGTGMLNHSLVRLGGMTFCLFPWLGTRAFRTMRKFIVKNGARFKISGMEFEGCYYMTFKMESGSRSDLIAHLNRIALSEGIDKTKLISPTESPVFEKYDDYLPLVLLQKQYREDRLDDTDVLRRLGDLASEERSFPE